MTAEALIRAARARSNAAIARHDADGAVVEMTPDARVIASTGGLVPDRAAMRAAFAGRFAEAGFVTFVRAPERIEVDPRGQTAAEFGRWASRWHPDAGRSATSGPYLARWRCAAGRWLIEAELFVPLSAAGG